MRPDWVRALRDECAALETAFFFKQWGEWAPLFEAEPYPRTARLIDVDGTRLCRAGRKVAGRLLDGREWNQIGGKGSRSTTSSTISGFRDRIVRAFPRPYSRQREIEAYCRSFGVAGGDAANERYAHVESNRHRCGRGSSACRRRATRQRNSRSGPTRCQHPWLRSHDVS
uniref:DUF5131 family protein n=1 Tax=Methylocaldum sp. GT1BB TaxID=3438963 RepID=UPI003F743E7B